MSTPFQSINPTGYLGLKETNPPNITFNTRDPTSTDVKPFDIGDIWYNKDTQSFFILASKELGVAVWNSFGTGLPLPVTVPEGGTGRTSLTVNAALVGDGTNPIIPSATFSINDSTFQAFQNGTNAGGLVTLGVGNSDNTNPLSNARMQIITGGPAAGDPQLLFDISASTKYALGIDNSDADAFVLSPGTVIGLNNLLRMSSGGVMALPQTTSKLHIGAFPPSDPVDLTLEKNNVGGIVSATLRNTDNTNPASGAQLGIGVAGGGGGDPAVTFNVAVAQSFTTGIDNSDADKYKISASNVLGTTDVLTSTAAGVVSLPLQPSFYAYASANIPNITGAVGPGVMVVLDSTSQNVGLHYDTTTGQFTAPETGIYMFNMIVNVFNLAAGHLSGTASMRISGSPRITVHLNPFAIQNVVAGVATFTGSMVIGMLAAQTCEFRIGVEGGAAVVGVQGGLGNTSFSGSKIA